MQIPEKWDITSPGLCLEKCRIFQKYRDIHDIIVAASSPSWFESQLKLNQFVPLTERLLLSNKIEICPVLKTFLGKRVKIVKFLIFLMAIQVRNLKSWGNVLQYMLQKQFFRLLISVFVQKTLYSEVSTFTFL